jgi:hypothetical protein
MLQCRDNCNVVIFPTKRMLTADFRECSIARYRFGSKNFKVSHGHQERKSRIMNYNQTKGL